MPRKAFDILVEALGGLAALDWRPRIVGSRGLHPFSAAAETVPDAAGLKIPPADVAALREALRRLICEDELRRRLGEGSWRAGQTLPRWRDSASLVAEVFWATARV
jgi:glycosyltransferase involved in cell wall biosynthesis